MKFKLMWVAILAPLFLNAQKVKVVGSMSEMGKENFAPHIKLDTIANKKHLYGIGPYNRMLGEITIVDGKPFYSSVNEVGDAINAASWKIESPFFVSANVPKWKEIKVSVALNSEADIQKLITELAIKNGFDLNTPFSFRIKGHFDEIVTHVVMPRSNDIKGYVEGKKQADYTNIDQDGELIGFFSNKHQGVFTSKSSLVHVHFISDDYTFMGHLDKITQAKTSFSVFLPQK